MGLHGGRKDLSPKMYRIVTIKQTQNKSDRCLIAGELIFIKKNPEIMRKNTGWSPPFALWAYVYSNKENSRYKDVVVINLSTFLLSIIHLIILD
jgi:hypothetical protein